jgi:hypothetical protein
VTLPWPLPQTLDESVPEPLPGRGPCRRRWTNGAWTDSPGDTPRSGWQSRVSMRGICERGGLTTSRVVKSGRFVVRAPKVRDFATVEVENPGSCTFPAQETRVCHLSRRKRAPKISPRGSGPTSPRGWVGRPYRSRPSWGAPAQLPRSRQHLRPEAERIRPPEESFPQRFCCPGKPSARRLSRCSGVEGPRASTTNAECRRSHR